MNISPRAIADRLSGSPQRQLPPWDRRFALYITISLLFVQGLLYLFFAGKETSIIWLPVLALLLNGANAFFLKWPFKPYDRILSAFSNDGIIWHKEPGIRLDVGGAHKSLQVYSPCVVSAETGWRMFYRGGGYNSVILSAVSMDGLHWQEEAGQRVALGGEHSLTRIDFPAVATLCPGHWRLFYGATDGRRWRIFSRESSDQVQWGDERLVLDMSHCAQYPHAFDPVVLADRGGWRMFFTAFGEGENLFYTAYSTDGIEWREVQRCSGIERGNSNIRNACVVRLDCGQLRMYFSEYAVSIIGSHIASAVSKDGVNWQREDSVRLTGGGPFDTHGVFCPSITAMAGGMRMYYGGYWGRHWFEWLTWLHHRRARTIKSFSGTNP